MESGPIFFCVTAYQAPLRGVELDAVVVLEVVETLRQLLGDKDSGRIGAVLLPQLPGQKDQLELMARERSAKAAHRVGLLHQVEEVAGRAGRSGLDKHGLAGVDGAEGASADFAGTGRCLGGDL